LRIDQKWFHPMGDDYLQRALASDEAFAAAVQIEQRAGRQSHKFQAVLSDGIRSTR
jgi:hypothetical protein